MKTVRFNPVVEVFTVPKYCPSRIRILGSSDCQKCRGYSSHGANCTNCNAYFCMFCLFKHIERNKYYNTCTI